jgi:glycosyltransferase involved in cell wall biosynthesis
MNFDIILPVYNEQKVLGRSIDYILQFINEQEVPARLIIVTNGCLDKSVAIAQDYAKNNSKIIHYNLKKRGKGRAVKFAILKSEADVIGYIDADLSIDIKFLYKAMDSLVNNFDIVICSKMNKNARIQRSRLRFFLSKVYIKTMQFLFKVGVSDLQAGCKVFSSQIAKYLAKNTKNNKWFFDSEFILLARQNNFSIKEIAVDCFDKRVGASSLIWIIFDHICGMIRFFIVRCCFIQRMN